VETRSIEMKYKVIEKSCLPKIRLALSPGQILDDEADERLTPAIIAQLKKDNVIEGGKSEPKSKPKKEDD